MKPKIVLSGVTLRQSGSLVIYREALASVEREYGDRYDIVALVKNSGLFTTPRVTYVEFPQITQSWWARLRFEYWSARSISAKLKPRLWLSMHETTPNVRADIRAVYCHNVSEFYRITPSEFLLDWRFGMFTLFFKLIHRINIRKNQYVIVQADWIRKRFERTYDIRNVVVAPPELPGFRAPAISGEVRKDGPYRFFYPAYPRPYKNAEVALEAARILERRGFNKFELWLTWDALTNKYAAHVVKAFRDLRSACWLGVVPRERVRELYRETDCLLIPSRLESGPLPISEFKNFGKPVLVADLPYAHESSQGHTQTCFFDPNDAQQLALLMEQAVNGEAIFHEVPRVSLKEPHAHNWAELWAILLDGDKQAVSGSETVQP